MTSVLLKFLSLWAKNAAAMWGAIYLQLVVQV